MLFNRFEFLYNFARPDQIIEVYLGRMCGHILVLAFIIFTRPRMLSKNSQNATISKTLNQHLLIF